VKDLSDAQDHDRGGLDQGGSNLAFFQPQFSNRVGGDHGRDLLAPDLISLPPGQRDAVNGGDIMPAAVTRTVKRSRQSASSW
jgi:hypothetical protein